MKENKGNKCDRDEERQSRHTQRLHCKAIICFGSLFLLLFTGFFLFSSHNISTNISSLCSNII